MIEASSLTFNSKSIISWFRYKTNMPLNMKIYYCLRNTNQEIITKSHQYKHYVNLNEV